MCFLTRRLEHVASSPLARHVFLYYLLSRLQQQDIQQSAALLSCLPHIQVEGGNLWKVEAAHGEQSFLHGVLRTAASLVIAIKVLLTNTGVRAVIWCWVVWTSQCGMLMPVVVFAVCVFAGTAERAEDRLRLPHGCVSLVLPAAGAHVAIRAQGVLAHAARMRRLLDGGRERGISGAAAARGETTKDAAAARRLSASDHRASRWCFHCRGAFTRTSFQPVDPDCVSACAGLRWVRAAVSSRWVAVTHLSSCSALLASLSHTVVCISSFRPLILSCSRVRSRSEG